MSKFLWVYADDVHKKGYMDRLLKDKKVTNISVTSLGSMYIIYEILTKQENGNG